MGLDPASLFGDLDLAPRRIVIAAVSGGGDSLALLFLLKSFLDVHASNTRLLAVTIDHRLRAEAATEARTVAELCRAYGIDHQILAWSGAKPATGLSAAARDARHRLLTQAAQEAGADIVLTGHTSEDQAETVAMRAKRGDGEGLAGMAPATLHRENVWFCRPLLHVRRAELRDWLTRRGISWIDDPSNHNPAFERVRVRAVLSESDVDSLARKSVTTARTRIKLASDAAALIDEFATLPTPGLIRLDGPMFERDAAVHALRAILAAVGGTSHLPDRERAEALAAGLASRPLRATLSRAVIDGRQDGIWIRREARTLPTMTLTDEPTRWDGRWRLSVHGSRSDVTVAPIGRAELPEAVESPALVPQSLARAAFSAEPGVFIAGAIVGHAAAAAAQARGIVATPGVAAHATYLPSFDIVLAAALRRLIGLPLLPATPWKHHIAAGA